MRIRYNIRASIQTVLEVNIPESWNFYLSEVTDVLVIFSGDPEFDSLPFNIVTVFE
jgi:hypothetical protein